MLGTQLMVSANTQSISNDLILIQNSQSDKFTCLLLRIWPSNFSLMEFLPRHKLVSVVILRR